MRGLTPKTFNRKKPNRKKPKMTEQNLALDYANSIAEGIFENCDNGTPFGLNDYEETERVEFSAYDYLEDVLDIVYMVDGNGNYRGAELTLAVGGPNVYLDTRNGELTVHWDTTQRRWLPSTFTTPLNEALEELWESGR